MQATADERFNQLHSQLKQLAHALARVEGGDLDGRDPLSVSLHTLIGGGQGSGILLEFADAYSTSALQFPLWSGPMSLHLDPPESGPQPLPVVFGMRGVADDGFSRGDHAAFLDEIIIGFPGEAYSRRDLIRWNRHNYGAHASADLKAWLRDLRIYPAAGGDLIAFMLWDIGREVLSMAERCLSTVLPQLAGMSRGDRQLRGVRLFEALVGWDGSRADIVANVQMAQWADAGPKRPLIGGYLDERPFIFGINGDGRLVLEMRGPGMELKRFARQFSA